MKFAADISYRRRSRAWNWLGIAFLIGVAAGCGGKTVGTSRDVKSAGMAGSQKAAPRTVHPETTPGDAQDAVIVGAGISGLSAALELGRGGARVTVVDMSSVFGGHAVMSQGGVCIVDTPVQRRLGIKDSPDLAFRDFVTWGEDADREWVRDYVDHSRRDIYDWLTDLGVRFESVLTAPGNTVNRFHQPEGRGIGLVAPIYRECLARGSIRFLWNTRAEELLIEHGRVVGVAVRNERTHAAAKIRASAVILATGGFQSNLDMVREFWPRPFRFPKKILLGSGRNSDGSGHRIARKAGAQLVKMDHQWNYFTGIPDPRSPGGRFGLSAANMHGIIVNADGKRFANLHNWAKEVMPALLRQKEATLWFVFDEASKRHFTVSGSDWADFDTVDRLILRNPKIVQSAMTVEELASKAGLPPKNLAASIRRYNTLVTQGTDVDFHRFGPKRPEEANNSSPAIASPPFYAMQTFPITRKSMGGVAIDRSCRVLNRDGKPIPGLFAVGELTGLAGINGKAALEGTFLGPCIFTGRIAGRTVLKELGQQVKKSAAKATRCADCHDIRKLIAKPRPGYWHFERVHRVTMQRGTDCRVCHAELAPYRKDRHRINPQSLATSCISCHVAKEH